MKCGKSLYMYIICSRLYFCLLVCIVNVAIYASYSMCNTFTHLLTYLTHLCNVCCVTHVMSAAGAREGVSFQ